jgi:hypothetical protein
VARVIDELRRECLHMFEASDLDNLLYAIRLIYEYNCEEFDADIVSTRFGEVILDKNGNVFLPDSYTRHVSMKNAKKWQEWVDAMLRRLNISRGYYKDVTSRIERLTYEGLKREYNGMPQSVMDEVEDLNFTISDFKYPKGRC